MGSMSSLYGGHSTDNNWAALQIIFSGSHQPCVLYIKVPTFPSGGCGRKKGLEAISLCTKRDSVCFVPPPPSNIMVVQLH